ncbi:MAG: NUDIX hydrolase [Candidatus Magasanikbacteria bacterium]|nr:NUDIX hydrolase [Candidatus Magasanikbacteria bacterium]
MSVTLKVAAVIVNSKNEILLLKEQYEKEKGLKWNIIKGTFDNPKETLEDCVKREVKEEVGLEVGEVFLKKIFQYGEEDKTRMLFVFYTKYLGKDVPRVEHVIVDELITEARWFSYEEIEKFSADDFMAPYVLKSLSLQKQEGFEGFDKIN